MFECIKLEQMIAHIKKDGVTLFNAKLYVQK